MGLFGFFHLFQDYSEIIRVIDYILTNDFFIGMGKYIILQDQISTKNGKLLGKKGENSFAFTSVFSDKDTYEKILEDGIIDTENFISTKDISRDEFDERNNLKKATTLTSYKEFVDYIEKHNLK